MLAFVLLLLLPLAVLGQFPPPRECTGDCFTHDPAVIKRISDGRYFRFSTLDLIGIWTAPALSGPWTRAGSVINGKSVIDLAGNDVLWAPDVSFIKGTYYCFYSVSVSGSQTSAIGYATSKSLDSGSWKDHGVVVTSTPRSPYNAIDANLVQGPGDGEFYLQWGSYWKNIYQSKVEIHGEDIFKQGNELQIAYKPDGIHKEEGPFIYRKDGFWYMFLSVGSCCTYNPRPPTDDLYRVVVCRSSGPSGPYVDRNGKPCTDGGGTVVLASHANIYAPGGQGVFYDNALGDVFYYHYLDLNIGVEYNQARFGWNVLRWDNGWPTLS
ncbi:hypothetical protein QQS21_001962 [Conoideocrella luteorostrata]|uniref:Arabinan endo-1,5-alpha-L-arabinosidase n=1 Tax=Conoideocrella luteorostrata TaxID=1105319 RepID=A0AAJ0FWZ6_9HYPO|nr:hypothetical protein QQS21_001962 [Conoideocrella luteorostrata]